jgi:hypothetical protein
MYKNGPALPILSAVLNVEVRVSDMDTAKTASGGIAVVFAAILSLVPKR